MNPFLSHIHTYNYICSYSGPVLKSTTLYVHSCNI